jgi:hypothetical protein
VGLIDFNGKGTTNRSSLFCCSVPLSIFPLYAGKIFMYNGFTVSKKGVLEYEMLALHQRNFRPTGILQRLSGKYGPVSREIRYPRLSADSQSKGNAEEIFPPRQTGAEF